MPSKIIQAAEAKSGLILAEAINDEQGRVILGAGGRLSPLHIKRLSKWGIRELTIEVTVSEALPERSGESENQRVKELPQLDEEYMKEMAQLFSTRFSGMDKSSLMETLKKCAFKQVVLAGRNKIPGVY